MEDVLNGNAAKAKQLLKEAGYDGTPIVLMQSTDLQVLTNLAPVAKAQLERGRLQGRHAVDGLADAGRPPRQEGPAGQGRLARLPDLVGGGRHPQSGDGRLLQRLVRQGDVRLAVRREIEKLRDQFAKETDPAKQKEIAEDLQKYWVDHPTHVNLGQWYAPLALRNNVDGNWWRRRRCSGT